MITMTAATSTAPVTATAGADRCEDTLATIGE